MIKYSQYVFQSPNGRSDQFNLLHYRKSVVSTCRFEGCVKCTWKQNALKCKSFKPHSKNRTKAGWNTVLDVFCVNPVISWLPVLSYFQLNFYFCFNRIKTFGHGKAYYIIVKLSICESKMFSIITWYLQPDSLITNWCCFNMYRMWFGIIVLKYKVFPLKK